MRSFRTILLLQLASTALASTVTYNWNIGWLNVNPDGQAIRPVVAVNGQWPPPTIEANVGDTIVVNVHNSLGNETTSLHFHGQFQQGTPGMDGPVGANQCAIPVGSSFTYKFTAFPSGTFWWHSHDAGQYPDGLRGPLIVHDRDYEKSIGYDQAYTLTVSDWYHDQLAGPNGLINYYLGAANNADGGAEPIPKSGLINDKKTDTFDFQPGKKYLFRAISFNALAAHFLEFEDHEMTVTAVDGVPVVPTTTQTIYLSAAQRYDFTITAKKNATKNYSFIAQMDNDMFDSPQPDSVTIANGILRYSKNFPNPAPLTTHGDPLDDFSLVPSDQMKRLPRPDQTINLNVNFSSYTVNGQEVQRAALGPNGPYIGQKVPTLYTALSVGKDALNPIVYGNSTNTFVLRKGQIIDVVVNNYDTGGHPFHLHGTAFQCLHRGDDLPFNGDQSGFPAVPMRRDTFKVNAQASIVLRFKADNPGVFLFHCHIEWHVEAGLSVTFVSEPLALQNSYQIPNDHLAACKALGNPTQGNCAGNQKNPLDTKNCISTLDADPVGAYVAPSHKRSLGAR